jgi:hypothetical protein
MPTRHRVPTAACDGSLKIRIVVRNSHKPAACDRRRRPEAHHPTAGFLSRSTKGMTKIPRRRVRVKPPYAVRGVSPGSRVPGRTRHGSGKARRVRKARSVGFAHRTPVGPALRDGPASWCDHPRRDGISSPPRWARKKFPKTVVHSGIGVFAAARPNPLPKGEGTDLRTRPQNGTTAFLTCSVPQMLTSSMKELSGTSRQWTRVRAKSRASG